jgi:hypothetical protein
MISAFRATLTVAAVALSASLVACSEPKPVAPVAIAPPVSLSSQLIEQASAYRYYMDQTSAISPAFTDGAAIASGVKTGAAYEPKQFQRGVTAYGAIVALQDKTFVAGVRAFALDPTQRRQVAAELIKNPAYALGITGADSAAKLVISALGDDGNRLYAAGKAVKQSAYDVQHQPWSKTEVVNRDFRLAQAKTLSATQSTGDLADTARLQQAVNGAEPLTVTASQAGPHYSPVVVRSLAVAALGALGEATDANMEAINAVMVEPAVGFCMNMAKLNLYQCLAVSKPHYEDVFCLGQHIMMDTGRCVIKSSGLPEPYEARFIPDIKVADAGAPAKAAKGAKKSTAKKR